MSASAIGATGGSQNSGGAFLINGPDPVNNAGSMWAAQIANGITNSRIAQAEDYNTQMADTVYQRGVADMKAAGLNPILAAGSPDPMASAPFASAQMAAQNNMSTSSSHSGGSSFTQQDPVQVAATQSQTALNNANALKVVNDTSNSAKTGQILTNEISSSASAAAEAKPSATFASNHPIISEILDTLSGRGSSAAKSIPVPVDVP